MDPRQTLVFLLTAAVHNASQGYYSSTQFTTQVREWAEENTYHNDNHDNFSEKREQNEWSGSIYYMIYSALHNNTSIWPIKHQNIWRDFLSSLELSLDERSLYITIAILQQSDKGEAFLLDYDSFKEHFINSEQLSSNLLEFNETTGSKTGDNTGRAGVFYFIFMGLGLLIMGLFGLVGNVLSILVLASRKMRSSFSVLLIGLAVSDIIVLIRQMLFRCIRILSSYGVEEGAEEDGWWDVWRIEIVRKLTGSAVYSSIFFTMAITVERYIIVCHPVSSRNICTWKKAGLTSGVIFLISNIAKIPYLLQHHCYHPDNYQYSASTNYTYQDCLEEKGSDGNKLYRARTLVFNHFITFILPVTTLLLFNGLIYLKIRKANIARKGFAKGSASPTSTLKEYSLTKILFAIVTIFMVANIPGTIIEGLEGYDLLEQRPRYFKEIKHVTYSLFYSQFALDFLVYFVYGKTFRDLFSQMFCGWKNRITGQSDQPRTSTSKASS